MGRQEWLREELTTYEDPALYDERDEREQYERVKGAGRATPREQAIIRELAAWRETEARRRDRPRSHVISDEAITLLARRKPHTLKDLKDVRGLPRRDTERVLGLVQDGLSVPDSQCPRRPRRRRHHGRRRAGRNAGTRHGLSAQNERRKMLWTLPLSLHVPKCAPW